MVILSLRSHALVRPTTPRALTSHLSASKSSLPDTHIVIVGGGWAGFSAAESLSHNSNVRITLLDASKGRRGGGLSEAGMHGFWREYRNVFSQIEKIGLDVDQVLSPYSPSTLFSRNGKVATAPVILDDEGESKTPPQLSSEQSLRKFVAAKLPPPLDLPLLAQLEDSTSNGKGDGRLDPIDLASGVGLVGAWADFEQESAESWANYDSQPASLLFEKAGVSDRLFEEMVSPLLHVLPMCPAYDCSAAAALSCFHVFALQSRGAFDVRWCLGSISELIFDPWQKQLEDRGVTFRGGTKVSSISKDTNFAINLDDNGERIECDAIVLAVGAVAAGRLASSSPALSSLQTTKNFDKLRGVTCIAVRLFLKESAIQVPWLEAVQPSLE